MTTFLIPILVGAFGWFLVWGFVQLIFYPIRPIEIGPFKWESLASKWLNQIDLTEMLPQLTGNESFEMLKPLINDQLDAFFRHKLSAKLPMISMFIGDKTIEELKSVFMDELALLFPVLMSQFGSNLDKDLKQQWQHKFSKVIYLKTTRATMPLRWIAFGLGAFWGWIIGLILPHI